MTVLVSGGWCAPSEATYEYITLVEPERWPVGLTDLDLQWIATMLWLGGIDVAEDHLLNLPTIAVRRGGIRWPGVA